MSLSSFALGLIQPAIILYFAIKAYVYILLTGLREDGKIPRDLRDKAFGIFWEEISGSQPDPNVPLVGSATLVPPLLAQAGGVVLDVGPGSGSLIGYFEPALERIEKIYGAEPAIKLHNLLRRNADATRCGRKYELLNANATKTSILQSMKLEESDRAAEIFDTIVCVRVLCSVPNLEATVSDLHALLKPGGRLLICEHTANPWRTTKGSTLARIFQTIYMLLGWSYFVGDCSLTRNIEDELRKDSTNRWKIIDIDRHFRAAVLTYISGVLQKH